MSPAVNEVSYFELLIMTILHMAKKAPSKNPRLYWLSAALVPRGEADSGIYHADGSRRRTWAGVDYIICIVHRKAGDKYDPYFIRRSATITNAICTGITRKGEEEVKNLYVNWIESCVCIYL